MRSKEAEVAAPRIDPNLPEDLRFVRAGQHFVVFVQGADSVTIVDFLLVRSDLPERLAELADFRSDGGHRAPDAASKRMLCSSQGCP